MKPEQDYIPTSKTERAVRFVKTGVKIGGNYLKHYAKKALDPELSKEQLHEDNAADIYETLSELKGSALKVAQMLSMDRNMLPKAYTERFVMAQYSAPPLSGPLVSKTFFRSFGKFPEQLFDRFNPNSVNAASIGQVHEAWKDGKRLAVKIQYPGVADSIQSDLKMVKPIALRMFQLNPKDLDKYIEEVQGKLLEETDYELELRRSMELSAQCAHIPNLRFPGYYPEYSSSRILTMDWMEGKHLNEFLQDEPATAVRDTLGQALWNFYDYQLHTLKAIHADPHPGNFFFGTEGQLGIIDFGCIKEVPADFYYNYFALLLPEIQARPEILDRIMQNIEMLHPEDDAKTRQLFTGLFLKMTGLLSQPFATEQFDFGDEAYLQQIYALGEEIASIPEVRNSKQARGSRHALYVNRTYFGIYIMLGDLKAKVNTRPGAWKQQLLQYWGLA